MIRVVSTESAGSGLGHELTDKIEGLRFSNVLPGGDETCTFTYKAPWRTFKPEIQRGCLLRVMDGVDVLWQGRIEESDHGGSDTEEIVVTAFGLGARLKDSTFQEIYKDQDLNSWRGMSRDRRIALLNGATFQPIDPSVSPDVSTGAPALTMEADGEWGVTSEPDAEAIYDAGVGLTWGSIYVDWQRVNAAGAPWQWLIYSGSGDDSAAITGGENSGDLQNEPNATGTTTYPPATPRRFAMLQFAFVGAPTANNQPGVKFVLMWRHVGVFGTHGLTKQGTAPTDGFFASQMVADVVGRVSGMTARRIDAQSFVIQQMVFREPTVHEDAITEINKYEDAAWGTWGPDSPLDTSTNGYFDYTDKQPTVQHWFAFREECDGLDLHAETATLFDTVKVAYTDEAGTSQIVTRTATNVDLNAAGMAGRTLRLSGGTMSTTQANQLGDTFLAIFGGFAPARGSMTLKRPIRHYQRGYLPPWYLRADGSNIRIPDVLPSVTLFSLDATPDKRTTFPIKRVEVDCSGSAPSVSVELDQTNDLLSVLQARLGLAAQLVGV